MANPAKKSPSKQIVRERTPDFIERYANYSHLTGSIWDLRLLFGQTDPSLEENVIPVHTSLTLPWAQVKVLSYFLQVHLAGYEADNGRVKIPAGIIPRITGDSPFLSFYEKFIAENPEAASTQDDE